MNQNSFFSDNNIESLFINHTRRYRHIKNSTVRNLMLIYTPRSLAIEVLDRAKEQKNQLKIRRIEDMILGISEFNKDIHNMIIEISNDIHNYAEGLENRP